MRISTLAVFGFSLVCGLFSAAHATAGILYSQNFESPTGFNNDGGDINIFRTVNQLYGNQPGGFTFAQANTVETLLLTGSQAFGSGYTDPQGIGGNYAISMLATYQNDLLGLSFNVQGNTFLNFRLNISSIDVDRFSGPFNPVTGSTPSFVITLFDNPSGVTGLSGNGTVLDSSTITGAASSARSIFNWTEHIVALNASGSTNGNVTVRIDLLNTGNTGYAALDNFLIVASNTAGDVGDSAVVPEPASLTVFGLCGLGLLAIRRARNRQPVDAANGQRE